GDVWMRVRPAEAHLVHRLRFSGREPQGVFEAAVVAEDRVLCRELFVYRRGPQRPGRRQLLVREPDAEAARVVFADLCIGVREGGPVAVAADVWGMDVGAGVAV